MSGLTGFPPFLSFIPSAIDECPGGCKYHCGILRFLRVNAQKGPGWIMSWFGLSFFLEPPCCSPWWLNQCAAPATEREDPFLSTALPTPDLFYRFDNSCSNRCEGKAHHGFNFISTVMSGVKRFSVYLLAVSLFFRKMSCQFLCLFCFKKKFFK